MFLFTFAAIAAAIPPGPGQAGGGPLASPVSDERAWELMPKPIRGGGQALPVWARMIAPEMPRTAAAFLQLDHAQRTRSPVEPKLRAAMRWVAADANRCEYAKAYAAADARRAGVADDLIAALGEEGHPGWSDADRAALAFAREMSLDSDSVTDEQFAYLVAKFGPRQTASMVLAMAFANFQDRALILLRAEVESGGPLPPVDAEFDPVVFLPSAGGRADRPNPAKPPAPAGGDLVEDDADWLSLSYDDLQARLEAQREKPTRLPIPEWDEIAGNLPEPFAKRGSGIIWYRIAYGYAPELAIPFEYYMRTAGSESAGRYDRVFGQSLFWITTRAVKCPYCMGHCEMNWEVAGLSKPRIAEVSRQLAGDDWSAFPPAEQRAFALARKAAREPWEVTNADLEQLVADFGRDRALIVAMNIARHHYMVRISNGFQLKLERENVFFDYHGVAPVPAPAAGR
jgi:alkylhydroperoxidase family enzyme